MSTIPVTGNDLGSYSITFNPNGQALMAASKPVVIASNQTAIPITDNSGSLTVDGTVSISGSVAVTGTFWQATQPVSGTFWQATQPVSISGNQAVNNAQVGGTNVSTGNGVVGAGVQRVAIASDNTAFSVNVGTVTTLPALVAGAALIGKVGIDQTTDGTTNKVNIDASLKSGTATRTSVNSSVTSATILASNANRKGATIFNSDANALLLDLSGGTAASTRCQVRLAQYASYEVGSGFTGAVTGIWEADGSGLADVVEFT